MPIPPFSVAPAKASSGGQTAWDAIVATSGGNYTSVTAALTGGAKRIWVRSGTYTEAGFSSGSPNTTTDITIAGDNSDTAILSLGANSFYLNGASLTIMNVKLSTSTGVVNFGGANLVAQNLQLLTSNQTNTVLITNGVNANIDNLTYTDTAGSASSVVRIQINGNYSRLENSYIKGKIPSTAFVDMVGNNCTAINNHIENTQNSGFGILLRGNGSASYWAAIGNTLINPGSDTGIGAAAFQSTVVGNTTINNNGIGIYASGGLVTVSGNVVNGSATGVSLGNNVNSAIGNVFNSVGTGVAVSSSQSNNIVSGNLALNSTTGISIGSGATNTVVTGNSFDGVTTNISDSGTSTIYEDTVFAYVSAATYTLPTAVGNKNRRYTIKETTSTTVTVGTTSSQTIDGASTYALSAQYKYVTVVSDGANWNVIANN